MKAYWKEHPALRMVLMLVLFVLARKGIAAQAPLYLPGRVITIAVLAVGALAFVLANAMPNLPLPESLHNLLVFNDDWGTYRGVAWRAAFGTWADGSLLRKIVGIGPGMMHTAVAAWAGDAMTARMATFYAAHNEYLEQLLTTGILGLAAWLLLVAAHLRRGGTELEHSRRGPSHAGAVQLSGTGGGIHPGIHGVSAGYAAVRCAGGPDGPGAAAARRLRAPRQKAAKAGTAAA